MRLSWNLAHLNKPERMLNVQHVFEAVVALRSMAATKFNNWSVNYQTARYRLNLLCLRCLSERLYKGAYRMLESESVVTAHQSACSLDSVSVAPRPRPQTLKQRATVLCRRGDEVLLVRKARSKWSLPGGKIEREETPEEAALRELAEETGLEAQCAQFLASVEWKNTRHYLFEVDVPEDRAPSAANEIKACCWMKAGEMSSRRVRRSARMLVDM
jgi:8-oxo-dGTP diphosphatase